MKAAPKRTETAAKNAVLAPHPLSNTIGLSNAMKVAPKMTEAAVKNAVIAPLVHHSRPSTPLALPSQRPPPAASIVKNTTASNTNILRNAVKKMEPAAKKADAPRAPTPDQTEAEAAAKSDAAPLVHSLPSSQRTHQPHRTANAANPTALTTAINPKPTVAKKAKPPAKKKAKVTVRRSSKKPDRGVPFEEMRRLMDVYGPTKCLRKRQSPKGDNGNAKVDSVKRKFYRWFPDLEERFEKDDEGFYRPKLGHEFEMKYREEMRRKDGEILTKKRANCRKQRLGTFEPAEPVAKVTRRIRARGAGRDGSPVSRASSKTVNTKSGQGAKRGASVSVESSPVKLDSPPDVYGREAMDVDGAPVKALAPLVLPETSKASSTDAPKKATDRKSKQATCVPVTPVPPSAVLPTLPDQAQIPFIPDQEATAMVADAVIKMAAVDAATAVSQQLSLEFDHDLTNDAIIADCAEDLDSSFVVDHSIFDTVDDTLRGSFVRDGSVEDSLCGSFARESSSTSEEQDSSDSLWDRAETFSDESAQDSSRSDSSSPSCDRDSLIEHIKDMPPIKDLVEEILPNEDMLERLDEQGSQVSWDDNSTHTEDKSRSASWDGHSAHAEDKGSSVSWDGHSSHVEELSEDMMLETSEHQGSQISWDGHSSHAEDMLNKTMEEYCEEILATEGDDDACGFQFELLSG